MSSAPTEKARDSQPPPLAADLARFLAEMPEPPTSGVDEHGRLIPLSDEEWKVRAEKLARTLAEIDRSADESDSVEVWQEAMRSIDKARPHRPLFEGMY